MDLQHLRNLLVVVEQGSISHAAALIGISQPALTRQIQALQKEFDAPLFDRTRRSMALSLSRVFLPQLVLCAASDMPGVRLSVSEGYTDDLCERLLDGRLDLAIADYRTPMPKLLARPLFREPIVAVGAVGVSHPTRGSPCASSCTGIRYSPPPPGACG